jgi:hypothetical protein
MQSGGYGRRYHVRPRFYIIIVAILVLSIWILLNLLGVFRQAKIEWGRLSSDQSITAIVFRNETLVPATQTSRLSCIAAEGQALAKDAPVATLYLSGYSEKDLVTLSNFQNVIKDYQENNILKDSVNPDLVNLNNKIDDKMNEISGKAISHQTKDMAVSEQELKTYIQQRKDFMLTIVNADDKLNLMYQQEANLQSKINQTRTQVNAPADGLVSYYLDGYEANLTVASIPAMTPTTMKPLLETMLKNSKPFKSDEVVSKDQPICRIVDATKWYAAIVVSTGESPFVQGMAYDVTFTGLQKTVSAKAIKVTTEGRNTLAVLEVKEGMKEMMSLRLINGHLGRDIEGFRIPLGMVKQDNGRYYIGLKGTGSNVKRIEVTLLGHDDRYAIIEDKTGEGGLAIGLPLTRP